MWKTFANLTTYNTQRVEDLNIKLLLNDISSFFLKLGTLANHKSSDSSDILVVLDSVTGEMDLNQNIVQGKTSLDPDTLSLIIRELSSDFFKKNNTYVIQNTGKMKITINNSGKIEKIINAENFFENSHIPENQVTKIAKDLSEIAGDAQNKENRFKRFIKEWGGTITEVGMTALKETIFK